MEWLYQYYQGDEGKQPDSWFLGDHLEVCSESGEVQLIFKK